MPLYKGCNGNSVGNKGVKICIKSEFLNSKTLPPPSLCLSYHRVEFERFVISFTVVIAAAVFLPVLNSL